MQSYASKLHANYGCLSLLQTLLALEHKVNNQFIHEIYFQTIN